MENIKNRVPPCSKNLLQNLFQLFQMRDNVGWLKHCFFLNVIYENSIHTCIHGAKNVGIKVVAKHQAFMVTTSRFVDSEVKNAFVGFKATCYFGGYYFRKVTADATIFQTFAIVPSRSHW